MSSRSVGWHAIITLAGQWAKYVVQILALVIFSRLLGPEEFGVVAMVTAIVGIAYVLGDFGLSLAALQAEHLTDGQRSNLFWLASVIGLATGVVVAATGPALVRLYDDDRVGPVALALGLVFVANGLAAHFRTELNRARRFGVLATADVSSQVAGLVVGLVVILTGGGLWGLVAQQITAAVVALLVAAATAGWWPGLPRRGQRMGGLVRFGSLALAASTVQYVSTNVDQVLIGRTWGAEVVGVYNRAFQVARVPAQQIGAPLTRGVLPHLVARLEDPEGFDRAVRRAQGMLAAALICLFGYLIAVAPGLVEVALGPGWDRAVPFVQLLCVAGAFEASGRVYYWILLAHGRPGRLFGAELAARTAMVAAMVLVVSHGAIWVAGAAVLGQILLLATNALVVAPAAGIDPWPLLGTAAAVAVAVAPGTLLCLTAAPYLEAWPALGRLAVLTVLWLAGCAVALVVPAVRAHVRESLGYLRTLRGRIG